MHAALQIGCIWSAACIAAFDVFFLLLPLRVVQLRPLLRLLPVEGQLPGEGAEDAADTVGVQAGPLGDLVQGEPLPPEPQDRAVFGGAVGQDSLPQVARRLSFR